MKQHLRADRGTGCGVGPPGEPAVSLPGHVSENTASVGSVSRTSQDHPNVRNYKPDSKTPT